MSGRFIVGESQGPSETVNNRRLIQGINVHDITSVSRARHRRRRDDPTTPVQRFEGRESPAFAQGHVSAHRAAGVSPRQNRARNEAGRNGRSRLSQTPTPGADKYEWPKFVTLRHRGGVGS